MEHTSRTRNRIGVALATGALAVAIVIPAIAQEADGNADSDAGTVTDQVVTDTEGATTEPSSDPVDDRRARFVAALAAELEIDADRLTEAFQTVREELRAQRDAERQVELEDDLADAVAAGDLTEEQAAALLAAYDADVLPLRPGRDGGPGGHRGPGGWDGPGGPPPMDDEAA